MRATTRRSPRTAAICCLPPVASTVWQTLTSTAIAQTSTSQICRARSARRVSVGLKGLDASLTASDHPAASSDGRYVAFVTRRQGPGRRAPDPQVFVRDTELHTTRHVGAGWDASISGDGRFVSFVGIEKGLPHILLADLHTGATSAITKSVRRGLANGASGKPKMSSDGRFVVFQSEASDLVAAEDFNLLWDVFVFDRTDGRDDARQRRCRRRMDGVERRPVDRCDADRSSPSHRATRPMSPTSATTSIFMWQLLRPFKVQVSEHGDSVTYRSDW